MSNFSDRLHNVIPGGSHTYSRGDDQYPKTAPQILSKGKGCRVWDPDGRSWLDYGMGLRSVTLGYADERVNEAAVRAIYQGNNLSRASYIELEAAEAFTGLFDGKCMVKFAKNGSTVTTAAVKLARAFTGRDKIAVCAGQPFYSYDDWFIGQTCIRRGIPVGERKITTKFNFNDIDSVKKCFSENPNSIAAVILEPMTTEWPENDFLKKLKKVCQDEGAVLIFDEMITGFRWGLPGAQTRFGVEPDLSTFGKGIANGFSVAALVGKPEIMELGGIRNLGQERVFLTSTTHGAEMGPLAAFLETLKIYKNDNVVENLWSKGAQFTCYLQQAFSDFGVEKYFEVNDISACPTIKITDKDGVSCPQLRTLFLQEMARHGVLFNYISLSQSHSEQEFEETMEAINSSLMLINRVVNNEISFDDCLECPAIKPVFRKYN